MNELTRAVEQPLFAWIVKGTATPSPFTFQIEAGPIDQGAIGSGDGAILLDENDHISAVGLTAPAEPMARLPWEDFLRARPLLGVENPDTVPLSNDVTYVQDLLELSVRDDLLGPAEGPHELIKDMSVRDRYLVGKLAPRRPNEDQTAQVEPASSADEAGDLKDERTASLHDFIL